MSTFIQMKKKNQLDYNAWNEHLNNTKERTNYSIRRMDLLIISICGAGIYIIFETLREFKTGKIPIENSTLLLICGLCFLKAIIFNFILFLLNSLILYMPLRIPSSQFLSFGMFGCE